jgi:hypothetical protein
MVTTLRTRKPGSTMANGMALSPATSDRLACVTSSTDAISGALDEGAVLAAIAGDVMLMVSSTPL